MGTNKGNIPDEGVMGAVNNNNRLLAKIRQDLTSLLSAETKEQMKASFTSYSDTHLDKNEYFLSQLSPNEQY